MSFGDSDPYSNPHGQYGADWTQPGFGSRPSPWDAPSRTSGLAITSLVSALVSPLFLCLCPLALIPSFIAILTGHLALREIKRSGGAIGGTGISLAGLIIGYPMLLVTFALFGWLLAGSSNVDAQPEAKGTSSGSSAAELHLARAMILIDGKGTEKGFGNREEAQVLARQFADQMKRASHEYFSKRLQSVSKDPFVTYCALEDRQCAFLVLVPDYRKFDRQAQDELVTIAWRAAQEIAATKLQPGDGLAVALKGQFLLGSIRIGDVAPKGSESNVYFEGAQDDLLDFFDTRDASLTPEMLPEQIDLGPDERPSDPFAPPS